MLCTGARLRAWPATSDLEACSLLGCLHAGRSAPGGGGARASRCSGCAAARRGGACEGAGASAQGEPRRAGIHAASSCCVAACAPRRCFPSTPAPFAAHSDCGLASVTAFQWQQRSIDCLLKKHLVPAQEREAQLAERRRAEAAARQAARGLLMSREERAALRAERRAAARLEVRAGFQDL